MARLTYGIPFTYRIPSFELRPEANHATAHNLTSSPLLRLPAEIKSMIWALSNESSHICITASGPTSNIALSGRDPSDCVASDDSTAGVTFNHMVQTLPSKKERARKMRPAALHAIETPPVQHDSSPLPLAVGPLLELVCKSIYNELPRRLPDRGHVFTITSVDSLVLLGTANTSYSRRIRRLYFPADVHCPGRISSRSDNQCLAVESATRLGYRDKHELAGRISGMRWMGSTLVGDLQVSDNASAATFLERRRNLIERLEKERSDLSSVSAYDGVKEVWLGSRIEKMRRLADGVPQAGVTDTAVSLKESESARNLLPFERSRVLGLSIWWEKRGVEVVIVEEE